MSFVQRRVGMGRMGLNNWMTGVTGRAMRQARRFARDARGNIAMMMGLTMPILVLMTMGGVDIHRLATVRMNLQDALDAATLAAARTEYVTDAQLKQVGWAALKANLADYPELTARIEDASFTLSEDDVVIANASVRVKSIAAHIFLPPYGDFMDEYVPVASHSEVNRATKDIEVSLVLDITGSMAGTRMTDLQEAANDLVDLVVQTNQDINRTRMALVPYSMGVNAGGHVNSVRGGARGATDITAASWMVGTEKTIASASRESEGVFTSNGHGFQNGDTVWLSGVTSSGTGTSWATEMNGKIFRIVLVDADKFKLERGGSRLNTNNYNTYGANTGKVRECQLTTCEVLVTSANHGLSTGEDVRILAVEGMTQINTHNAVSRTSSGQPPLGRTVTRQSDSTFSLNNVLGPNVSAYSRHGTVQCLEYGCQNYLFTNNENALRVYAATNCVSERTGDQAYTDAAPAAHPVSFIYTGTTNVGQGGCMSTTFTPLTSARTTLHDAINAYIPEGGTAGQIGVGWGWYMISPTFAGSFLPDNQPDPYGTRNLLKVVILMTDGEFNAVYYDGVRARDSGTGGGSNERWINHDSANGNPFKQSARMCDAMKARNILIYTVGFDVSEQNDPTPAKNGVNSVDTAQDVMEYCATSAEHVYLPATGASLKTAFAAIGRSISRLRISK